MSQPSSSAGTLSILFTDLVDSTALIARAGDSRGQTIFHAHRKALNQAASNTGREVKWTGDGLMMVFSSTADAVRVAMTMQRAARGPIDGEQLRIRVGINVGEALVDGEDYFGASVVVARRLCDAADAGQIYCSDIVMLLLRGQKGFEFVEVGELDLKGIPHPVRTYEVQYDVGPRRLPSRPPYVGRTAELGGLLRLTEGVRAGRGAVALVSGEPGIGKTRFCEEVAEAFRNNGGLILWGRCYEADRSPPFSPFVQAVESYASHEPRVPIAPEIAEPLSRLVPSLADGATPDSSLPPDEERYRLTAALARLMEVAADQQPLMLVLDDMHWADSATVFALRHLARSIEGLRACVLATYRDSDLQRGHPFADAVLELPRETDLHHVTLGALEVDDVAGMLNLLSEHEISEAAASTIARETGGNPFFIRELFLHLIEERAASKLTEQTDALEIGAVPENVRHVLQKRIDRLAPETQAFLAAAAAFDGAFPMRIVARVSGLTEDRALDALDEAAGAHLIVPAGSADEYHFAHALLRHALRTRGTPSRRARLHRAVAEALLEETVTSGVDAARSAQLAEQFHLSRDVGPSEVGAEHAMIAAEHARSTGAFTEALRYLELAADLTPSSDPTLGVILLRQPLALAWLFRWDEAVEVALRGAEILERDRPDEAADRLALASATISASGSDKHAWMLIPKGLELVGDRRDLTWAVFTAENVFRANAEDPDSLGVELDVPERHELNDVLRQFADDTPPEFAELRSMAFLPMITFESRREVLDFFADRPFNGEMILVFAGEYRTVVEVETQQALESERRGHLASAAFSLVNAARAHIALGDLAQGRDALTRAWRMASVVPRGGYVFLQIASAQEELTATLDSEWEEFVGLVGTPIDADDPVAVVRSTFSGSERQFLATINAVAARLYARIDRTDEALRFLDLTVPALRVAPCWAINLPRIACLAADTIWLTEATDHLEDVARAIRDKLIAPDFRYPSIDARHSLAQLAALRGDVDEAREWFERARALLGEQGARPLLAICDHDEALMYGRQGDAASARRLFDSAIGAFADIGMSGWITRAERHLGAL